MKFFVATKNPGKIREFERIFTALGDETLSEKDFKNPMPEPVEDGKSFIENALIKARAGAVFTGLPSVADDSGLCVDALSGAPGIFSARYAGVHGDDEANNRKLLSELSNVPMEKRKAHYTCAIACVFPDGREFVVEDKCNGYIDFSESGNEGFGYDPLFISDIGKFSEIPTEKKDEISHRGKAVKKFEEKLKEYL